MSQMSPGYLQQSQSKHQSLRWWLSYWPGQCWPASRLSLWRVLISLPLSSGLIGIALHSLPKYEIPEKLLESCEPTQKQIFDTSPTQYQNEQEQQKLLAAQSLLRLSKLSLWPLGLYSSNSKSSSTTSTPASACP